MRETARRSRDCVLLASTNHPRGISSSWPTRVARLKLSARGYHRILRVARTLADLEGAEGRDLKENLTRQNPEGWVSGLYRRFAERRVGFATSRRRGRKSSSLIRDGRSGARFARAYRIHYRKASDKNADYLIEHTAVIFLMAPDGKYLTHIPPDKPPKRMVETIRQHMA